MSQTPPHRIGCVSFLNARPLIEGLDDRADLSVRYDVPARLLADLLAGEVDVALCPAIDYQMSDEPLVIVPVGGIACDGPTHTVRLFSRVPFEELTHLHIDTDSHTSVALTRVLLRDLYQVSPKMTPLVRLAPLRADMEAALLIGDKVVTHAPSDADFPYQLDLGQAWKDMTGLPFVFAVWMAKPGTELGDLPAVLDAQRQLNRTRIRAIVEAQAPRHDWPLELAERYLGHLLRYRIGARELEAMQRFWARAHELGVTPRCRPLQCAAPSGEQTHA